MARGTTAERTQERAPPQQPVNRGAVVVFKEPRLPYHPDIDRKFHIDRDGWGTLVEAIWPAAKTSAAVVMALDYCKARHLDPFKRPVHIVPVYSTELGRLVETVWPGIGELRTTAFRTGLYAGRDETAFGPDKVGNLSGTEVTFPEWAQVTVYRLDRAGQRMAYPGPKVRWLETYATAKRDTTAPNAMWKKRPWGQLEKCAEAAALRAAFPEELGNDWTAEEMEGQTIDRGGGLERDDITPPPRPTRDQFRQSAPVSDAQVSYVVIDADGEEREYHRAEDTAGALRAIHEDAARRGQSHLSAAAENNSATFGQLQEYDADLARGVAVHWNELMASFGDATTGNPPARGAPEQPHSPAGDGSPSIQQEGESGSSALTQGSAGRSTQADEGTPAAPAGDTSDAPRDMFGGPPAENLTVPLERNPTIAQCDFFMRQMRVMLDEVPLTPQRVARIKAANEREIGILKGAAPTLYDQVQAALAEARRG